MRDDDRALGQQPIVVAEGQDLNRVGDADKDEARVRVDLARGLA